MQTTTSPVGAIVRVAREAVGLSLAELGRRVGTSKNTLSLLERGQRDVSRDLLGRIARAVADEADSKWGAA